MEKMINSIDWFEIPVLNFDRAKEFYSRIYNYEMTETTRNSLPLAEKPPNTTLWVAPMRAQACMAITPSSVIGM